MAKTPMEAQRLSFLVVHGVTLYRLLAAMSFATLQASSAPWELTAVVYGAAIASDVLDGCLARALRVDSLFGRMLDLVADKALTISSLLYAVSFGISIIPLAIIGIRDLVMIGFRLISIEKEQLLPTSRTFGGLLAGLVWCSTLILTIPQVDASLVQLARNAYALAATMSFCNLIYRVVVSREKIKQACDMPVPPYATTSEDESSLSPAPPATARPTHIAVNPVA
jgi:phosphatidylglycerophosphate synthase